MPRAPAATLRFMIRNPCLRRPVTPDASRCFADRSVTGRHSRPRRGAHDATTRSYSATSSGGTRALTSHIAVTTQCVRTSERKEHGVWMVLDGSRWFRLPQLETPRRNACPALSTPLGRLRTLTRSANACGQLLLSPFAS